MGSRLVGFLCTHCVPIVSLVIAGLSFVCVPTTTTAHGIKWWQSIDLPTLNLLFCLMFVIAGLRECNLFRTLASRLLKGMVHYRQLALTLTLFTFALAMLITNDVALIAMVPFSFYILDKLNLQQHALGLTILETLAANLGSMATPIGNPQNLFLYTSYHIATFDFFKVMLPITLLGTVLLILCALFSKKEPLQQHVDTTKLPTLTHPLKVAVMGGLFLLCLAAVFRLIPHENLFLILFPIALLFYRKTLRAVDYGLLLTFTAFFIFSHNISCIPSLESTLRNLLQTAPQTTAILTSQVLSNVPAAILLSNFTTDWKPLLLGVDIGGFGTLIASLASLISFNFYLKTPHARPWKYLAFFTIANLFFLLLLSLCSCFL